MNRNYSDISYAESPFGTLSEFMSKTFGWMFAGLLVTFLVGIGAVTTGLIYPLITSGLFILTSIAELVLVFVLLAPLFEALLWPLASWLLLVPQRRAPDPDENRPL